MPRTRAPARDIPFSRLRANFAVANRTSGRSPRTVEFYEYRLELFERFLGPDAALKDVTLENARAYIADLQGREERYSNTRYNKQAGPLSSAYIQGFARTLRAFSSWLEADGYTKTNVLKTMKLPRIQQKVVEPLSDEEIRKLLSAFNRDEPFGARDIAIVWTLLDCGLRSSELRGLLVENAHLAQGYLKVLGKGNKERLVPIGRTCQEALVRWRDRFRPVFEFVQSPYLFLDSTGQPMSGHALESIVRRAALVSGIDRRIHCHLLRHTFATNYLVRQVGDPLRLQQILGHTSLEMVRRYVAMANVQRSLIESHSSPMDLIAAAHPFSPQARRVQPARRGSTAARGMLASAPRNRGWQGRG